MSRASHAAPPDGGPRVTTAKIKSALRLVALDERALALGLKPMMALADARAMHPQLLVHEADPAGEAATHEAIVDWCRFFTPLAAPDGPDGALLDITGVAHLFGGETGLMTEMRQRLARQGFVARLAIADTTGAAAALARFGGDGRIVPEGLTEAQLQKLFAPLPLAALRLDEESIARLSQAGLRRIGDLLVRPRAPIAARFGRDIHHRLDILLGRARAPISPRFAAPPYLAERRFSEGLARLTDIEATLLSLAHDLCAMLARHGEGARRLDVALYRVDGVVKHIEAGTSRPLRDPPTMARLFRERLAAAGEDGLDTGYGFDVIRLVALAVERLDALEPGWADRPADESELADLIDRFGARFGRDRVSRLALMDRHQPEEEARLVEATATPPRAAVEIDPAAQESLPERPVRLLERPEPIETLAEVPDGPPLRFRWRRVLHHVAAIEGPERIAPDWWMTNPQAAAPTRDYFRAEDTNGRRFWLYREGLYHETPQPRWFVHGLFA